MTYTTADTISIAKVSQYLSQKDIFIKAVLGGGLLDTRLPHLLYLEIKSLEDLYAYAPSDERIVPIRKYVLSLCGKYLFEAVRIVAGSGTATIVNPTTGFATTIEAFKIQLTVGVGIAVGATSYTIPYAYVLENSVSVEKPESNLPEGETTQLSYTIAYGTNSTIISFTNDAGGGNLGVLDGIFMISGLRYTAI